MTDARTLLKQQEQVAQKARDDNTQAVTALDTVRQHLAEAVNTVEKVSIALNSWMVAFNTDHPGKPLI
jgi:hypothetical protein